MRIIFMVFCTLLACHQAAAQIPGQVDRGDVTIHYQVFGEGFPVVLLSGGPGGSSSSLLPIVRRLEDKFQLVLIDQRGTGRSRLTVLDSTTITLEKYVEDVDAVRRDLEIDRWLVVGHSWGGGLAMAVTATHPGNSAGMVLIGSIGIDLEYLDYAFDNLKYSEADRALLDFWSDPERKAADPDRAAYEYYRALLPSRLYRLDDMPMILENLVVERDFSTIAQMMTEDLTRIGYDLRRALSTYGGPVLILQGRQGFLGGRTAEKIVETLPNAEIAYIEKSGHFPFVEQPEAFFAALDGFLQEHFSEGASGGDEMNLSRMKDFALSYTTAWSSQDPARVAAHFAENGSLQINDGPPSVGRDALTATAESFMTELPDLVLTMDGLTLEGDRYIYRWTLHGTNTGPGGSGHAIEISGYEEWTLDSEGLILRSLGHMDLEDYQRQLSGESPEHSD